MMAGQFTLSWEDNSGDSLQFIQYPRGKWDGVKLSITAFTSLEFFVFGRNNTETILAHTDVFVKISFKRRDGK